MDIPQFNITKGAKKAIELLNDPVHFKFFSDAVYPLNEDLLLAYRIFFQLINREDISQVKDNKMFWALMCKYFAESAEAKIGIRYLLCKFV